MMKVKELIEILNDYDEECEIEIKDIYGEKWDLTKISIDTKPRIVLLIDE